MQAHRMRAVAGLPPILTFGGGALESANLTSVTFNNVGVGNPHLSRYIAVAFMCQVSVVSSAQPSLTVNGAGTNISVMNLGSGTTTSQLCAIFVTQEPVTTGTTVNITASKAGETMTRSAIAAYSIVTRGYEPIVFQSLNNSNSNITPAAFTSLHTSRTVGITAASGGTGSTITGMNVTGPVGFNYFSGIFESGGLLSATVTGPGTVNWSSTGSGATIRPVLALWT